MTWQTKANCRGLPTDLFFPEDGQMNPDAKEICDQCSVIDHCLNDALDWPIRDDVGIRAGMTQHKRRLLRSAMRRRQAWAIPHYVPQAIEWDAEQRKYVSV